MRKQNYLLLVIMLCLSCSQNRKNGSPGLTGDYFGEEPPGSTAKLFAPGIVSTPLNEDGSPVFTPDGNEVFWRLAGSPVSSLVHMKRVNGIWSKPEMAEFSGMYQDAGPTLSPDGKKLFFDSKRPETGIKPAERFNIWITEKTESGWSDPVLAEYPVNNPDDYYTVVSFSSDGTLIKHSAVPGGKGGFDLYICKFINGKYSEPENLPGEANTEFNDYAPSISPDGSYILFQSYGRPDSTGSLDLYVTYRKPDGRWTKGINLGESVNTEYVEKWPSITTDGNFIFFISSRPVEVKYAQYFTKRKTLDELKAIYEFYHKPKYLPGWGDVYWVDAEIIAALKPDDF